MRSLSICPARSRSLTVVLLAGLGLSAPALAVPPVVDRCPADAMLVVAVPNFEALQKDIGDMAKLIGMPLPMDLKQAMLAAGIDKGVRSDGSAAIIVLTPTEHAKGEKAKPGKAKPDDDMGGNDHKDKHDADAAEDDAEERDDPPTIAIIPVTDYSAFLENFGAKPDAAGTVVTMDMKGKEVFAKDIGDGYAALSPVKGLLDNFTGKAGSKAAFETLAGPAGNALADKSDMCVIVNIPRARPTIDKGMKHQFEEMADRMAMMGGEEPDFTANQWLINSMLDDARGMVLGLNIDNLGAGIDIVTAFNEGTRWSKMSNFAGKSTQLLGKLPAGPYLVALAADLSSPEIKSFMKDYVGKAPAKKDVSAMPSWFSDIEANNGGAMVIGMSPAGFMGGMFSASSAFTATADPASAVKSTRSAFQKLEADKKATVKWNEGEKDIAGVKVDSYELKMAPDPENPFAAQASAMLFGPAGGPSGYIAQVEDGVVMTMAKNSKLMEKAINAAGGKDALGQEKVLAQVGAKLPEGRAAEAYIGVKGILDTFLPMAAMFGASLPAIDVPENLPPLAAALTPQNGSMTFSIYLPAPTVKTIADLAREFKGMGGNPPPDAPDNKDDTGQPGF